ncbi:hypothetical protein GUITHDRAFT_164880 [Guillardia theta CCMP2712]|uniref:Uncharacterized protein n=1 Tax=Guillardia theta (strain CCMP2712) TaxID=905079 RepID=L1IV94_GUITC|nr:hypothetical protein GUITHDRAFT_164880 [Guillardia theta CCMP2712]EKX39755.1 hypothetical protein GUITHDRAFT_164880 [Guillardia theta CCMP2712]|eukprot:XP_005826735.1 hypothetical protein GUITHDRAFT_164880 [Guillardia theta CCMP2712]
MCWVADGTFFGGAPEVSSNKNQKKSVLLAVGAALLVVGVVVIASSRRVSLSQVDKDDGTDALINAVLVARGDSLPTKFVASRLNINPQLPFLGSSAYKSKHIKAIHRRRPALKQARLQSLELDPASQFCADPADCARDLDYFKANAIWHQAAHDMIGSTGPMGPAFPPNMDGVAGKVQYAWCDPELNPSCR